MPSPPTETLPAHAAEGGIRRRTLRTTAVLAAGLSLLAALAGWVGLRETASAIAAADLRIAALGLLVLCVEIPVLGLRWWLALRFLGERVSKLAMIRANALSNLVNFVAPGHFGEASAAYALDRAGLTAGVRAFAALIVCKTLGSAVNGIAGLVLLQRFVGDSLAGRGTLALSFGSTLVVLGGAAAILHRRTGDVIGRAIGGSVRVASGVLHRVRGGADVRRLRHADAAAAAWDRLRETFSGFARRPAALAALVAISTVKMAVVAGCFHLSFRAVGLELGLAETMFISVANDLGRFVFIHVPLNMGSQEAVIVAAAAALGLDPARALAAAVLYKGITVVEALLSVPIVLPALKVARPASREEV